MTVKCLTHSQQADICRLFTEDGYSIGTITEAFGRSRRTVIRVLEDHQIDPAIRRRPAKLASKPAPPPEPLATSAQQPLPFFTAPRTWFKRVFGRDSQAAR